MFFCCFWPASPSYIKKRQNEVTINCLQIYHELGGKEVEDQLAVAKYLRDNLHFVHPRKITIWGWSYGGYVTTMALARDADKVFSCGMAVAPVARWEHYGMALFCHPPSMGIWPFYYYFGGGCN